MPSDLLKNTHEAIFKLEDAKPEDVKAMRTIVRDAWVSLYPNAEYGITAEDLSAIDWYKPEGMKRREKEITENPGVIHTWVLKDSENKIVGFCKADKLKDFGEIDSMYVLPDLKGKGLGNKLMEKAFEWFEPNLDVRLKVVKYNSRAIAFYKKFGFKETTTKVLYQGTTLPSGKEIPRIEMLRQATLV